MKLTFLGTGTSTGVPFIGCECEVCTSPDPRDNRLRVSILIEQGDKRILVDTSADFRQQALRHKITRLDAVLITHCHADHVFGMDDLRALNFRHGAIGIYAGERDWVDLRRIFQYVFQPTQIGGGLPQLIPHIIEENAGFCFAENLEVTPLTVIHGKLPILAFRFNDFAYATDLSEIPATTMDNLRDLDVLVIDCVRNKPHPTHLGLEQALAYIEKLKPKRAFLTHLNHEFLYERDSAKLPQNVHFAYDGLTLTEDE
ncbi:MAG: MBL fold metallo-hydrolase [Pyrinomonadaceae bacterium]